ncbi:class I SAM-dependent methyltransferase [Bdellovibrio bacteriovorus]|uniref:class I SAM-dependent methyltransferase n=1 Tax=Bdellovibrio bacteriovorus TaxID=959 RepID=UPI0035A7253D
MKQNIYDDPDFFSKYGNLARSQQGLSAAGEWKAFRSLLPSLQGAKVLDLGCGYGWHCRYVSEQGASSVIGVDISEKMLAQAKTLNSLPGISYLQSAIEDLKLEKNQFDLVMSSLAFHYVADFQVICRMIFEALKPGGQLVFSMEHPIFTSRPQQDWIYSESGEILYWPVDQYQNEGMRKTSWLADNVIKYHRSMSTIVNSLLETGFKLEKLVEPTVPPEMLEKHPEYEAENRRPMFLLVSAKK